MRNKQLIPFASRDLPVTGREQRSLMAESRVWWQQIKHAISRRFKIPWIQRKLIRLYMALPARLQYRLAKIGIRFVIRKKAVRFQELLRH